MPRIDTDIKLDFKDVLIRPKRSTLKTRADVNLAREFIFRNSKQKYAGVPIMASNMDTVGTFEMARVLNSHQLFTCLHKFYKPEDWQTFAQENPDALKNIAISSGIQDADWQNINKVLKLIPDIQYICLDVANGYSEDFVNFVRKIREAFKQTLLAGNVVTGEMVEELVLSGADIIKVGIGPGSVCSTRNKTGVGYPQLSAILECADAAHGLGGHIVADGGCTCPGDVVKAFGAGADFVMLGGMLAGHDQSGGEIIERGGKRYKQFYGMSSAVAQKKFSGKLSEYRASEGKVVEIPYKGDVNVTILDILGGLRSACTYIGAAKLKELSRRTTFIRVTQQTNPIFTGQEVATHHHYETLQPNVGASSDKLDVK